MESSKVTTSLVAVLAIAALAAPGVAVATDDAAHALPAQKHFSPYSGRNFPSNVYWSDTHTYEH